MKRRPSRSRSRRPRREPPAPTTTAEQPLRVARGGEGRLRGVRLRGCHTFAAAGTTGTTGPDLDEVLAGKDAAFVEQSIVQPNAEIAEGYSAGVMPQTYGEQLSPKQVDDLVAFLTSANPPGAPSVPNASPEREAFDGEGGI